MYEEDVDPTWPLLEVGFEFQRLRSERREHERILSKVLKIIVA